MVKYNITLWTISIYIYICFSFYIDFVTVLLSTITKDILCDNIWRTFEIGVCLYFLKILFIFIYIHEFRVHFHHFFLHVLSCVCATDLIFSLSSHHHHHVLQFSLLMPLSPYYFFVATTIALLETCSSHY